MDDWMDEGLDGQIWSWWLWWSLIKEDRGQVWYFRKGVNSMDCLFERLISIPLLFVSSRCLFLVHFVSSFHYFFRDIFVGRHEWYSSDLASLYLIWFKGASIAGHQMRMLLPFRPACCLSCGDQRRWPKWPSPLVFIVSTDKQSPSNEDRCALTAAMVTGHVHEERLIIICNTVNNQILL